MRRWELPKIETVGGSRSPVVLDSDAAVARVVLIGLDPGQELGDHQVKEHSFVLVVEGMVHVEAAGETFDAPAQTLLALDPDQELGDHQVKEHSFVLVVEGMVHVEAAGETFDAPAQTLLAFEPDERRSISSGEGARIL